ncbi:MAG: integron [Sphingomonadaceae bacterium]|nr:integron [Sphingomonadaceae bacterium]
MLLAVFGLLAACDGGGSSEITTDIPAPDEEGVAILDAGTLGEPTAEDGRRPVRIGLEGGDFDACGGVGQVVNLDPEGDSFLAVRARPTAESEELDRLYLDDQVWMCDAAANGWHGIVYREGPETPDCGIASPVAEIRLYDGPCRAGWVSPRYIELIAG